MLLHVKDIGDYRRRGLCMGMAAALVVSVFVSAPIGTAQSLQDPHSVQQVEVSVEATDSRPAANDYLNSQAPAPKTTAALDGAEHGLQVGLPTPFVLPAVDGAQATLMALISSGIVALLALIAILSGQSSTTGSSSPREGKAPADQKSPSTTPTKPLTREGKGTVTLAGRTATLTEANRTVPITATVGVVTQEKFDKLLPFAREGVVSQPILLEAPGDAAADGVVLTRQYAAPVPEDAIATFMYFNEEQGEWVVAPTSISDDRRTITAYVTHLSYWTDWVAVSADVMTEFSVKTVTNGGRIIGATLDESGKAFKALGNVAVEGGKILIDGVATTAQAGVQALNSVIDDSFATGFAIYGKAVGSFADFPECDSLPGWVNETNLEHLYGKKTPLIPEKICVGRYDYNDDYLVVKIANNRNSVLMIGANIPWHGASEDHYQLDGKLLKENPSFYLIDKVVNGQAIAPGETVEIVFSKEDIQQAYGLYVTTERADGLRNKIANAALSFAMAKWSDREEYALAGSMFAFVRGLSPSAKLGAIQQFVDWSDCLKSFGDTSEFKTDNAYTTCTAQLSSYVPANWFLQKAAAFLYEGTNWLGDKILVNASRKVVIVRPKTDNSTEGNLIGGSIVGRGIQMSGANVIAADDQVKYVSDFGGDAVWLLSTGSLDHVSGGPDVFASTDFDRPGSPFLGSLANYPTQDAASFSATVVPTGSTLHVRYIFASEEYDEYVGSVFNDVMAITVDGENCAVIPGSDTPVSVNTVNSDINSVWYRPNDSGQADDSIVFDGLTKPMECIVAVQPNVPVQVVVSIADSSDGIYDSAVALLDKGIWSE